MTTAVPDLAGKTILVTGATNGIGLEAAVSFARAGALTVITGRDDGRIETALDLIRRRSGSDCVEALRADFASQAQVRALAAEFLARHERLDVLVNNAGSVHPRRVLTEDGIEATFAVNHLAPFLLTNLLLACLVSSAPARIVNVASRAHEDGTMDFTDLNFDCGYRIMRAYARSKLANVLFTRALARRLEGTGVVVHAVHPGTVGTGIWSHGAPAWARGFFNAVFAPVRHFAMLPPERGAQTLVHAATDPGLAERTGLYLVENRPQEPADRARDEVLAERLWEESAGLTQFARQAHG